jgi:hypothetical protein
VKKSSKPESNYIFSIDFFNLLLIKRMNGCVILRPPYLFENFEEYFAVEKQVKTHSIYHPAY